MNSDIISMYSEKYGLYPYIFKSIYNLSLKMKSIDNLYGNEELISRKSIVRFFSTVGKYENEIGKDLYEFNRVNMENLFIRINVITKQTFENRKHIIKNYMDWCVDHKYMTISDEQWFIDFVYEDLFISDFIKLRYFKSFDELSSGIKSIVDYYSPVDKHRFDIYIIAYCLSWFGFSAKEICKLPAKCVDYKNNCVILNGIKRSLNEETCSFIRKYMNTDGYNTKNAGYEYIDRLYKQSDLLIRTLVSKDGNSWKTADLQTQCSRIATDATEKFKANEPFRCHKFNLKDIYISGCFYRIYKYLCKTGKSIDQLTVSELRQISLKSITSMSKANFVSNYKNWASTFYA